MFRNSRRSKVQPPSAIRHPPAKIDVLKPDGMIRFVEPTQFFPYRASHHEKRARRLLRRELL